METKEKERAKDGVVIHLRAEAKARAGRKARAGEKAATARERACSLDDNKWPILPGQSASNQGLPRSI